MGLIHDEWSRRAVNKRKTYAITPKGLSVLAFLDLPRTLATVRRQGLSIFLALSDPHTDTPSGKPGVTTLDLSSPALKNPVKYAYAFRGFMYLHEWLALPPVVDYQSLPATLNEVRTLPGVRSSAFPTDHPWTATSNPWFDSDGVARLRMVPTPALVKEPKNHQLYGHNVDLAAWFTSPLLPSPLLPSPALPSVTYERPSIDYDQIFLRLLAASIIAHPTDESGSKYHIEVAADLAEAALAHLTSRRSPSCKTVSTPSSTTSPTPSSPEPK